MPIDDSTFNRYGFLVTPHRFSSQSGVNSEFVHGMLSRIEKLIASIEQIQNPAVKNRVPINSESIKAHLQDIKSASPDHKQEGIKILMECVLRVSAQLDPVNHKMHP